MFQLYEDLYRLRVDLFKVYPFKAGALSMAYTTPKIRSHRRNRHIGTPFKAFRPRNTGKPGRLESGGSR